MSDSTKEPSAVYDEDDPNQGTADDSEPDPRDVNAAVVEEWITETTPFERVYTIIRRTYEPQSASEIADRAHVSVTTAQKHLQTLAETHQVTTTQDGQTTLYRRSETAIITDHARYLLTSHSTDELAEGIAEMEASIRELRAQFGVETPEELAREQEIIQRPGFCPMSDRTCTEWLTTRQNLALAKAALAIAEAKHAGQFSKTSTDSDEKRPDGTTVV